MQSKNCREGRHTVSVVEVAYLRVVFSESHGAYLVSMPELEQFIEFLQQLSDMGAAMKSIITKVMLDSHIYEKLQSNCDLNNAIDDGVDNNDVISFFYYYTSLPSVQIVLIFYDCNKNINDYNINIFAVLRSRIWTKQPLLQQRFRYSVEHIWAGHNNHIDICLSIFAAFQRILKFVACFRRKLALRVLVEPLWNLFGGFSTYPTDYHAQCFACFDEFYVPHFHQGHNLRCLIQPEL